MKEQPHHLNKWQSAIAGGVAGLVSRFVISPLDVVKIRLQLQPERRTRLFERYAKSSSPKYRGMLDAAKVIVREEGVTALWKGNLAAEYLYLTYGAMQFATYNEYKRWLSHTPMKFSDTAISIFSGAMAGFSATLVTYPLDLIRTRFASQGQTRIYSSLMQCISDIHRNEGILGFYRGLAPSLLQIVPYMGLMFGNYELCWKAWKKSRRNLPAITFVFYNKGVNLWWCCWLGEQNRCISLGCDTAASSGARTSFKKICDKNSASLYFFSECSTTNCTS